MGAADGAKEPAAAVLLAAVLLAAVPAAAQTATSLAAPPFGYFGSSLVTHDLSPPAREAALISQTQMQQLYRALGDLQRTAIPPPPPCTNPADRPGPGGPQPGAPPACLPAPSDANISEGELEALKASPAP